MLVHFDNHLIKRSDLGEQSFWDEDGAVIFVIFRSINNHFADVVHNVPEGFFPVNAFF